jgi:hypothetical protein
LSCSISTRKACALSGIAADRATGGGVRRGHI